MTEHTHPPYLDVKNAAQASLHLEGHDKLSNYERLTHEAKGLAANNPLHWTALTELRADVSGQPAAWLRLTVTTSLPQICQRCLEPVDVAVQLEREFRFVESEAVAEAQDDDCEEDLLVTSREFDLAALIEDEVLLAMPLVPRHDTCPVNVKMVAADPDFDAPVEKPNPFAVLAQLKGKD
ncbi:MAG: hypothetical protein BWK72_00315 [Rhodoferax ferrireducens]|uniref:Large ribosomal RNA subunit accumulation protein YceD n=1 Tax=Rhodoferax ferrireducens TaxID=192843 RepID=A0A1W9KYC6_9BURK|nr:MAG: hypothetical protein BWK72_00315 [Rhodoferax ferrireducens]